MTANSPQQRRAREGYKSYVICDKSDDVEHGHARDQPADPDHRYHERCRCDPSSHHPGSIADFLAGNR